MKETIKYREQIKGKYVEAQIKDNWRNQIFKLKMNLATPLKLDS